MREDYGDALELTEVIYKLCHHISGPGVLKLHVPHPLERSTWPPVIRSSLLQRCCMSDLMRLVGVNDNRPVSVVVKVKQIPLFENIITEQKPRDEGAALFIFSIAPLGFNFLFSLRSL